MLELWLVYVLPTLFFCWLADGHGAMGLPGKVFTSALLPLVCCVEVALAETSQHLSALSSWGAFFRPWLEASGSRFAAVLAAEILFWAGMAIVGRWRSFHGD